MKTNEKMKTIKTLTLALGLAIGLTFAATADELKTMYGKASNTSGSIKTTITWYSDEAMTSTEGVITPWQEGSNTCRYVILGQKKWTSTSAVPDVPFYIGRDGATVGTEVGGTPSLNMNGGCEFTFPNMTIFHCYMQGNSDAGSPDKWLGTYRFAPVAGKSITFSAENCCESNGKTRGHEFAGTCLADENAKVYFKMGGGNGNGTGYGRFYFSGDFSQFKGSFVQTEAVSASHRSTLEVRLVSPTALGDTSTPRTDAFILRGNAHLNIGPEVVQGTERGITLSTTASQTIYLDNIGFSDWTLKVPVYGALGKLAKVGSGNVTLAGPLQTTNIEVRAGSLTLDPAATFAENTRITILSGAKVVSKRGGTVENVTFDVKDGGAFTYDFAVPCDGMAVTTLDFTTLTATDRAAMTKPSPIWLTQQLAFPINETNRLAVVRFSSAAGFTAADFTDASTKTYGYLPHTWFEMESDGTVDTLVMVVKPVITRKGGATYRPLTTQYVQRRGSDNKWSYDKTTPVWSDGLAAHAGADYVHNCDSSCALGTYDGWDNGSRFFPGDTFYLGGWSYISMKSAKLTLPYTVFASSSGISSIAGSPANHHFAGGPYDFRCNQTFAATVDDYGAYAPHTYTLSAEVRGEANITLTLSSPTNLPLVHQVLGTNTLFKGKVLVTNKKTVPTLGEGSFVAIAHPHSIGGDRETFAYDKLSINKFSRLRPLETMTLDQANMGIEVNNGGFDVPDGVTLTLAEPVRITPDAAAAFLKTGAGDIRFDGVLSAGTNGTNILAGVNNVIDVSSGGLIVGNDTNSLARASIRFHEGSKIVVPAAGGNEWGIFAPLANGIVAVDGTIAVSLSQTDGIASEPLTLPICTVSSESEDLSAVLKLAKAKTPKGVMRGTLVRETLEGGLVRYSGTWERAGLCVIVR